MKFTGHFLFYFVCLLSYILGLAIQTKIIAWERFYALTVAFVVFNCDWDLILAKESHRWFLTHSVLFPMFMYWGWHSYFDMAMAKAFAFVVFPPIIIHLIADLGGVQGFGLITFYPFHRWSHGRMVLVKLNVKGSYVWILGNIGGMIGYLILL